MSSLDPFVSQESDEWATPPELVRSLAKAIGGFDLDPCSGAETSPVADETYTESDDGLHQPWHGDVWVNPPYSDMDGWMKKAVAESRCETVDSILMLVKGDTSTQWYQNYAFQADAIAYLEGRLSFGDGGDAPFASHVLIFGGVPQSVFNALDRRGVILRTGNREQRCEQTTLEAGKE